MLTLADVEATLKRLAGDRPIFHSEDDFQHALDRAIRGSFPRVRVQLEQPLPLQDRRGYADLWLRTPAGDIVLELKYWTQALRTTVASEEFSLRAHSANDLGRYDLIKDLVRIEHLVDVGHAGTGAVIAITNDHLYWTKPNRQTNDADFRIHDGRRLSGTMAWAATAGDGTTRGREADLTLRGVYRRHWQPYSTVPGGPYAEFRYLFLPVDKAPERR